MARKKQRILVVDDEARLRQGVVALLTRAGYEVAEAEHGFHALLQLKQHVPDLLISDLNMPNMSGFELLSVVRRRFPNVSVIAVSGAYESAAAVPGGVIADAFYAKGRHSPEVLLQTVAELIKTSGSRKLSHMTQSAPVWIPRNGRDSRGFPYVVVTCTECLRSFALNVAEEAQPAIQETPCLYCANMVRYIVDFTQSIHSPSHTEAWSTL
jgi:CheY-like chemotaxis protein